jgi:hypothetical protein
MRNWSFCFSRQTGSSKQFPELRQPLGEGIAIRIDHASEIVSLPHRRFELPVRLSHKAPGPIAPYGASKRTGGGKEDPISP